MISVALLSIHKGSQAEIRGPFWFDFTIATVSAVTSKHLVHIKQTDLDGSGRVMEGGRCDRARRDFLQKLNDFTAAEQRISDDNSWS